jgi:hypothetical protein
MLADSGGKPEASGDKEVHCIHLKQIKIYNGDNKQTPSEAQILWRGKLKEVDSFFLGKILI